MSAEPAPKEAILAPTTARSLAERSREEIPESPVLGYSRQTETIVEDPQLQLAEHTVPAAADAGTSAPYKAATISDSSQPESGSIEAKSQDLPDSTPQDDVIMGISHSSEIANARRTRSANQQERVNDHAEGVSGPGSAGDLVPSSTNEGVSKSSTARTQPEAPAQSGHDEQDTLTPPVSPLDSDPRVLSLLYRHSSLAPQALGSLTTDHVGIR